MRDAIVVLNAGSSSLKFGLYPASAEAFAGAPLWRGRIERIGDAASWSAAGSAADVPATPLGEHGRDHARALAFLLEEIGSRFPDLQIAAAGHRVVHGGTRFAGPARIDDAVRAEIQRLVPLAPRHQPHGLAAIAALAEQRRDLLQVACFDTAFHRSQDPLAERFGLPSSLHEEGVRRYGFHGLSYEAVAAQLPRVLSERADGKVVVAHLGNGASLAALRARRSVATTMGLTPLDGLLMGTRPGALDPGVLLYLLREHGYDEARLSALLYDESGLLGVSGSSHDMQDLLVDAGEAAATAVALFVQRLVQEVASMAGALDGLDALVFTGGIGERSAEVRARACGRLAWLGIALSAEANAAHAERIEAPGSAIAVAVVATDEEAVIAEQTWRVWRDGPASARA
ncbi:MAG: acetate/propionate family kinase [Myxococcota bacterium]